MAMGGRSTQHSRGGGSGRRLNAGNNMSLLDTLRNPGPTVLIDNQNATSSSTSLLPAFMLSWANTPLNVLPWPTLWDDLAAQYTNLVNGLDPIADPHLHQPTSPFTAGFVGAIDQMCSASLGVHKANVSSTIRSLLQCSGLLAKDVQETLPSAPMTWVELKASYAGVVLRRGQHPSPICLLLRWRLQRLGLRRSPVSAPS